MIDANRIIEEGLKLYLRNFKKRGDLYNFSCPFCGDSKHSKLKARGYIYKKDNGEYNMTCKNCDIGMSLLNFTKRIAPEVYHTFFYKQFFYQKLGSGESLEKEEEITSPVVVLHSLFIPYYESKETLEFINKRKIPRSKLKEVYFIKNLNTLIEENSSLGYTPLSYKSSRLVFVIRNLTNEITGYVTRALNPKDPIRYYNISLSGSLLYGTPYLDKSKPVWIVEGIIDSLFLENSLAACSSSFKTAIQFCKNKGFKFVCLYDNEPYNIQIIKLVLSSINKNYPTVIFSSFPLKGKDVNEMILKNSLEPQQLQSILETKIIANILKAKLEYSRWISGN